ncbi:MAG: hypothetical protein FWD36_05230 [Treponema sp.]|nr:hypothetical protein [Treponema sp.]
MNRNRNIIFYGVLVFVAVFTFLISACDDNSALETQTIDAECNCIDWEWRITNPATTEADGLETEHCKNCSETRGTNIIPKLVFSISLSESSTYIFASRPQGYTIPPTLTVTVTNTGNQPTGELTISLLGAGGSDFTSSTNSLNSIEPEGTATFTVAPKIGLEYRLLIYTTTIRVFGANSINALLRVDFTVTEPSNTGTFWWGVFLPAGSNIDEYEIELFNAYEILNRLDELNTTTNEKDDLENISFNGYGWPIFVSPKKFGYVAIWSAVLPVDVTISAWHTPTTLIINDEEYYVYSMISEMLGGTGTGTRDFHFRY